jgi:hypothetical protein
MSRTRVVMMPESRMQRVGWEQGDYNYMNRWAYLYVLLMPKSKMQRVGGGGCHTVVEGAPQYRWMALLF